MSSEYEARGRSRHHELLRNYLFWNSGEPSFGEILREHVAFTVNEDAEIDDEIRALFAAFQAG